MAHNLQETAISGSVNLRSQCVGEGPPTAQEKARDVFQRRYVVWMGQRTVFDFFHSIANLDPAGNWRLSIPHLKTARDPKTGKIVEIPRDVVVLDIALSWERRQFGMQIAHETFPLVPDGCVCPSLLMTELMFDIKNVPEPTVRQDFGYAPCGAELLGPSLDEIMDRCEPLTIPGATEVPTRSATHKPVAMKGGVEVVPIPEYHRGVADMVSNGLVLLSAVPKLFYPTPMLVWDEASRRWHCECTACKPAPMAELSTETVVMQG